MWLVDIKLFPRIRLFFLVKGHTKNAADRMFNLLKNYYHKKDIYTYGQLYDMLNMSQYVDVFQMRPCHFHDHRKWQDTVYKTPAGGEFKRSHVFTICSANHAISALQNEQFTATTVLKQDNYESIIRADNLLPSSKSKKAKKARKLNPEERFQKLSRMEMELEQLVPTGLKPIKQVELWKKWAPLLPEEFRADTCPKPSDEVINSIKERNKEKSKLRTKQKKLKNAKESSDKIPEKSK